MKLHEIKIENNQNLLVEGVLEHLKGKAKQYIKSLSGRTKVFAIVAIMALNPAIAQAATPEQQQEFARWINNQPPEEWQQYFKQAVEDCKEKLPGLFSPEELKKIEHLSGKQIADMLFYQHSNYDAPKTYTDQAINQGYKQKGNRTPFDQIRWETTADKATDRFEQDKPRIAARAARIKDAFRTNPALMNDLFALAELKRTMDPDEFEHYYGPSWRAAIMKR